MKPDLPPTLKNPQDKNQPTFLGVRSVVWAIVCSVLILGVLTVSLSRRTPADSRSPQVADDGKSSSDTTTRLRTAHPGSVKTARRDRTFAAPSLSAGEARDLARTLANIKAKELYDCEPFTKGPEARWDPAGWICFERGTHGRADFEATIHFSADGTEQRVDVLMLDSTAPMRRFKP